jgi:tRNA (cytidine/uridine-2'-O-)-methyltransferase
MAEPWLHVVLVEPEIPPNTGNIGRLCLGVGARLHLVHPLGFQIDERSVRRAGLDYWKQVDLQEHADAEAFWSWCGDRRAHLLSAHGQRTYAQARFQAGDVLVLGRETVGLPRAWVEARGALRIPMTGPIRSLNLGNAASVVVYEALRQVQPELFG